MEKQKSGKNKKIILNPEGDQVIIDPEKMSDVKEAAALTIVQRRLRSIAIRRRMPKLRRARELAVKKTAGKQKIQRRSKRLARSYLKRRYAGELGKSYQSLSPSDKIVVDRMVASKSGASRAIATRLIPRVRSAEVQRVLSGKRASKYNIRPITASYQHPDSEVIEAVHQSINQIIDEIKMQGKDPCWKGYEMVGHKKKKGVKVPNCVPVKETHTKKSSSILEDYKAWSNDEPVKYAKHLETFFGKPAEYTDHRVVWYNKDGFKRIEVIDEYILHASPAPHYDFCYCYMDLKVPHDLAKSLAESSESIIIDFLKNEVGARCASLSANAVTLNYCFDVVENKVKPSKKEYERRIKEMKNMFSRGKRYELDWWPDMTKDTDPNNKYYVSEKHHMSIGESYTKKSPAQKLLDALKRIEARKKPLLPVNSNKPK